MANDDFKTAVERLHSRKAEVLARRGPVTLEQAHVDRFREAIGWTGTDASLPPTLVAHLFREDVDIHADKRPRESIDDAFVNPVNGGTRFELHRPPAIGSGIEAVTTLADVYLRQGKSGPLAFVVTETAYADETGPLAAMRVTMIYRGLTS